MPVSLVVVAGPAGACTATGCHAAAVYHPLHAAARPLISTCRRCGRRLTQLTASWRPPCRLPRTGPRPTQYTPAPATVSACAGPVCAGACVAVAMFRLSFQALEHTCAPLDALCLMCCMSSGGSTCFPARVDVPYGDVYLLLQPPLPANAPTPIPPIPHLAPKQTTLVSTSRWQWPTGWPTQRSVAGAAWHAGCTCRCSAWPPLPAHVFTCMGRHRGTPLPPRCAAGCLPVCRGTPPPLPAPPASLLRVPHVTDDYQLVNDACRAHQASPLSACGCRFTACRSRRITCWSSMRT